MLQGLHAGFLATSAPGSGKPIAFRFDLYARCCPVWSFYRVSPASSKNSRQSGRFGQSGGFFVLVLHQGQGKYLKDQGFRV